MDRFVFVVVGLVKYVLPSPAALYPMTVLTMSKSVSYSIPDLSMMSGQFLDHFGLVYNGYGCYCGIGGSGTPVDGIDRCCQEHDECYSEAIKTKRCSSLLQTYTDFYKWEFKNGEIICPELQSFCKQALCKCDSTLVRCWAKFQKPERRRCCPKRMNRMAHFFNNLLKKTKIGCVM